MWRKDSRKFSEPVLAVPNFLTINHADRFNEDSELGTIYITSLKISNTEALDVDHFLFYLLFDSLLTGSGVLEYIFKSSRFKTSPYFGSLACSWTAWTVLWIRDILVRLGI